MFFYCSSSFRQIMVTIGDSCRSLPSPLYCKIKNKTKPKKTEKNYFTLRRSHQLFPSLISPVAGKSVRLSDSQVMGSRPYWLIAKTINNGRHCLAVLHWGWELRMVQSPNGSLVRRHCCSLTPNGSWEDFKL